MTLEQMLALEAISMICRNRELFIAQEINVMQIDDYCVMTFPHQLGNVAWGMPPEFARQEALFYLTH